MRAFIVEIVGADDRGVPPRIASADPAFFKHGDVRNAVFLGKIICRAQTMPATADNDRIICWFGCRIRPLFGPVLVTVQCFSKEAECAETRHAVPAINGA